MENSYKYFKRDVSWLSFNYRVLLEAEDDTLPVYERIKFLSIYSSNLEEFYEIRVAEHRGVIMKKNFTEESGDEAEEVLTEITNEVNRQQREYYRIFSEKILPELNRQNIYLYQGSEPEPFHEEFVHNFFNEEVFPFLSPVMIQAGDILRRIPLRRPHRSCRDWNSTGTENAFRHAISRTLSNTVSMDATTMTTSGSHWIIATTTASQRRPTI